MAGKRIMEKEGVTYINKRNIKKIKDKITIWSHDGMDWIEAPRTTKVGDTVKWAGRKHKIIQGQPDSIMGTPRLTYHRQRSKETDKVSAEDT